MAVEQETLFLNAEWELHVVYKIYAASILWMCHPKILRQIDSTDLGL